MLRFFGTKKDQYLIFDLFFFLAFLFLVIIPMIYLGFTGKQIDKLPRCVKYLNSTFKLFPNRIPFWSIVYMQVQLQKDGSWMTLVDDHYFQAPPFGYRLRINRFFELFWKGSKAKNAQLELALWIGQRFEEINHVTPYMVRLLVAQYLPREECPIGYWQKPTLESFPKDKIILLASFFYDTHGQVE